MQKVFLLFLIIGCWCFSGCYLQGNIPVVVPVAENENTVQKQLPPVVINTYDTQGNAKKVVFDSVPQRVVLDIANDLETMLALGLGDHVALTSVDVGSLFYQQMQKLYPEEIKKVQHFSPHGINMENVIAVQTDFILGWKSTFTPSWLRTTSWWDKRGVKTYIAATSNKTVPEGTIEDECQYLSDMGRIFRVETKAQAYIDAIHQELARANKEIQGRAAQSVMVIELTSRYIINYDRKWLVGNMVETLGGIMPVDALRIGQEDLIYYDPEVIFVIVYDPSTELSVDFLKYDPKFQSMRAVKNRRIYPIRFDLIYAPSVRTLDGLKKIKQGLYPDLPE